MKRTKLLKIVKRENRRRNIGLLLKKIGHLTLSDSENQTLTLLAQLVMTYKLKQQHGEEK